MKNQSVVPRNEGDEINTHVKAKDEANALKDEISKLQFIIGNYEKILTKYQKKYGNEIFLELSKDLNNENNPNSILNNNEVISLKKDLIENVALFKEYEKLLLEKNHQLEFLTNQITEFQIKEKNFLSENEQLRNDLEKAEKDKNDLYNQILDRKNKLMGFNSSNTFNRENELDNVNIGMSDDENENENLKKEKEQLLKTLETKNAENQFNQTNLTEMKKNYDTLFQNKENLNEYLNKLKEENNDYNNEIIRLKNRIKELETDYMKIQNEKNDILGKYEQLKLENNIFQKDTVSYQDLYEEMENRKNIEINSLQNEIIVIKTDLKNLREKNKINEEKISNLKFENSTLKNENSTFKSDCDHLIKIIEDSNLTVQNVTQKENNMNNIIKNYKNTINNISLEKEKYEIKVKMQEEQIRKLTNDYSSLLKEKTNSYNVLVNSNKDKYENIIKAKDDELNTLKVNLASMKMDRDYYISNYKTLKNDYDKINDNFHSENDKYIKKYEESEKKLSSITIENQDKIHQLTLRNDKLESDYNILKSELDGYKSTEKSRQNQINKMNQNEVFLQDQIRKLKEEVSYYSKENENNIKEKERLNALNETKLKNLKDDYEMKIIVLENSINYHKNQLANVEAKAFDMIKKHENFEKKLTNEYNNTLNYYQNLISDLTGENINDDFQYPDQEDY
jgi:chromosome segregation ATPase